MKRAVLLLSSLLLYAPVLPAMPAGAADEESPPPDIGRYQLFMGEFYAPSRTTEPPERTLFRVDSATGDVWIGRQVQYVDKKSGKLTFQRYWEPFEQYVAEPVPAPPKPR